MAAPTLWLNYADPDDLAGHLEELEAYALRGYQDPPPPEEDLGADYDPLDDGVSLPGPLPPEPGVITIDGVLRDAKSLEPVRPLALPPAPPPEPLLQGKDSPWHTFDALAVLEAAWVDVPLLIPALDIGPGRPCGLVGAPGAGKSDAAQALALAVATGRDAFGKFPVTQGRVIHLSWDMGLPAIALRYRRLANGMGLAPAALRDSLFTCVHPAANLTHPDAEKVFAARFKGFSLAIIDNLRECVPGVDENDSKFGAYLTILGRAAQHAGTTVLYLHHTGKGGSGGANAGRGSNSVVGASGSLWLITGEGDEPRAMVHTRQHDMGDGMRPPFWLQRGPAQGNAFDVGGRSSFDLRAVSAKPKAGAKDPVNVVLAVIAANPGIGLQGLRDACPGMRAAEIDSHAEALRLMGKIENRGSGKPRTPVQWHAN